MKKGSFSSGTADSLESENHDIGSPTESNPVLTDHATHYKIVKRFSYITVEPIIFFYMFAGGVLFPAVSKLTYEKVCMESFPDDNSVCDKLHDSNYTQQENVVQTTSAHWFLYQHLSFDVPAIILSFIYGNVSDHFSRRMALILPIVGQALTCINYILCSIYIKSNVAYIIIGHLISGFFGGWITLLLSTFSYLSEITSKSTRTARISVVEAVISFSLALSYFISGLILDNTGYIFVFSLSLFLYIIAGIYTAIRIKEPKQAYYKQKSRKVNTLREACSLSKIKDSVKCIFRKRENNERKQIMLILTAIFTTMISYQAIYTLGYLFLKKQPLSWSQSFFGYFVGLHKGILGTALIVFVPLMKYKGHLRDTTIVMFAIISSSLGELIFACSTKTWMIFLVPVFGCLSDAKMTCMRALLSKLATSDELGQMFAAVGSIQSLSMILGTVIFNTLYPATLTFWPGFSFLVGVIFSIIPLSLMIYLHKISKEEAVYYQVEVNEVNKGKDIVQHTTQAVWSIC